MAPASPVIEEAQDSGTGAQEPDTQAVEEIGGETENPVDGTENESNSLIEKDPVGADASVQKPQVVVQPVEAPEDNETAADEDDDDDDEEDDITDLAGDDDDDDDDDETVDDDDDDDDDEADIEDVLEAKRSRESKSHKIHSKKSKKSRKHHPKVSNKVR